jgi:hypothetical protein
MARNTWRTWLGPIGLALVVAACGGGTGDSAPAPSGTATVDTDGGKVVAASAQVIVPPGAMATPATIRIAADSAGSPPLPNWVRPAGEMLAITPHGSTFSEPVTVRLRAPDVTLADNERLYIAKVQPGGDWEVLTETERNGDHLEVKVQSFSYFVPVIVPFTVSTTGPFALSPLTFECDGKSCANPERARSMTLTISASGNGGQVPQNCVDPSVLLESVIMGFDLSIGPATPVTSALAIRRDWSVLGSYWDRGSGRIRVTARLRCTDPTTNAVSYVVLRSSEVTADTFSRAAGVPVIREFPLALTAAVGEQPRLRAVFSGGASFRQGSSFQPPTDADQALVYFEQLRPGESGWTTALATTQTQADRQPLPGAQPWQYWSLPLSLGPLTLADQGMRYRVRACYGPPGQQLACAIGPVAALTVLPSGTAPAFTQQPTSLLIQPGQTASFSALVGGAPSPTLRWQTRPPGSTGAWVDVTGGNGAATTNYTTAPLQLGDNGVQFRLLATNSAGSTASEPVLVSVAADLVAPTITSQPMSLAVVTGSEAVFALGANGTAALSYQWSRDGTPITGANGAQLKIANASAADAGAYTVRVSNAAGSATSAPAVLAVTAVPSTAPVAPSIVTQPAAVAVTEGNVATFGVGVAGSGPLSFQWRRNGADLPGATAAAITIAATTAADAGTYSVVVRNAAGSATSQSATLAVAPSVGTAPVAPTIVVPPGGVVVAPGMSAALGVTAQGSGPLSYRWLHNGQEVAGQTGAVLTIASASSLDVGGYRVEVSNAAGSALSGFSMVVLLGAPAITQQPAAASVTEGGTATFGVTATGDALRYQWTRNSVAIDGATSASYTTPALALGDSGAVYGVVVYNGAGLVFSTNAVLTVTPVVAPPASGMALYAGDFSAAAGGGSGDGTGTAARFDYPEGLSADGAGNLYVASSNFGRVSRIDPGAVVTTIALQAGVSQLGLAPGNGDLYTAATSYCGLARVSPPRTAGSLVTPLTVLGCPGSETRGAAVDNNGVLYLALHDAHSIMRLTLSAQAQSMDATLFAGAANTYTGAGSQDGTGSAARFNGPRGIAFGPDGDLFVADTGNHTIRRITPQGVVGTFAGRSGVAGTVDGNGAEGTALFDSPTALAFDPAGNLVVLDRGPDSALHARVRRITPAGQVTTLFDAHAEALALAQPGQEAFAANIKGIAVLDARRIALSAGNAILLRTLP